MGKKKTTEEFIEEAKKVHGNKYDYSKVVYVNSATKVSIVCPTHGVFIQTPNQHLRGGGCRGCDNIRKSNDRKLIFGVGINDCEGYVSDDDNRECYNAWTQMLRRCYSDKLIKKRHTYIDCTVCDEWLLFSNFKRWFDDKSNGYRKGYFLDKDLLIKGNKIYSPETCCFLPIRISSITTQSNTLRGDLPIGVSRHMGKFRVRLSEKNKLVSVGCFFTKEEAFEAYKNEKERHITELAHEYYDKGEITEKVRDALLNFKIEITD